MEVLYRKLEDGTFEPAETGFRDTLPDGLWFIQTKKNSRGITSVAFLVGHPKDPKDILSRISLQGLSDDLCRYLMQLREEDSDEYKEAKMLLSGYLRGPVNFYNISPSDLTNLILSKISDLTDQEFQMRTRMFD